MGFAETWSKQETTSKPSLSMRTQAAVNSSKRQPH